MLGLRFSLKSFLGAVTFVSVAMASLSQPWRRWCPAMVLTGLLLMMLLSIPGSIYAHGRVRAFLVGFATVGWGYFLLVYSPWFEVSVGRELLASPVAESVCFAVTDSLGDYPYFLKVTHALSMFLLAYFGGVIARGFYVKHTEQSSGDGRELPEGPASVQYSSVLSRGLSLRKAQ